MWRNPALWWESALARDASCFLLLIGAWSLVTPVRTAVVNLPRSDRPGETGIPAIETAALLIVVVSAGWLWV